MGSRPLPYSFSLVFCLRVEMCCDFNDVLIPPGQPLSPASTGLPFGPPVRGPQAPKTLYSELRTTLPVVVPVTIDMRYSRVCTAR